MKQITFDVTVSETKQYTVSEEDFYTINVKNELKMDFNNLTKENIEDLYNYLDDDFVFDGEVHDTYINTDSLQVIEGE